MIEYQTSLWWEPAPTPLPIKTPEDNNAVVKTGEPPPPPVRAGQRPPPLPTVLPDDDYEWLLLL